LKNFDFLRFSDRHHAQPVTPLQNFQRDAQIADGINVRLGLQYDGEPLGASTCFTLSVSVFGTSERRRLPEEEVITQYERPMWGEVSAIAESVMRACLLFGGIIMPQAISSDYVS
jgi:hypothetical protein